MRRCPNGTTSSRSQNIAWGSSGTQRKQKFSNNKEGIHDRLDFGMEHFIKTGELKELLEALRIMHASKYSMPASVRQVEPCWFESRSDTGFGSTTQGQMSIRFCGRESITVFITVIYSSESPYSWRFRGNHLRHRLSATTSTFYNENEEELVKKILEIEDSYLGLTSGSPVS